MHAYLWDFPEMLALTLQLQDLIHDMTGEYQLHTQAASEGSTLCFFITAAIGCVMGTADAETVPLPPC